MALLVPLLAAIIGLVISTGMGRLPDIKPSASAEEFAFG
jgi:hypothetical protein